MNLTRYLAFLPVILQSQKAMVTRQEQGLPE